MNKLIYEEYEYPPPTAAGVPPIKGFKAVKKLFKTFIQDSAEQLKKYFSIPETDGSELDLEDDEYHNLIKDIYNDDNILILNFLYKKDNIKKIVSVLDNYNFLDIQKTEIYSDDFNKYIKFIIEIKDYSEYMDSDYNLFINYEIISKFLKLYKYTKKNSNNLTDDDIFNNEILLKLYEELEKVNKKNELDFYNLDTESENDDEKMMMMKMMMKIITIIIILQI